MNKYEGKVQTILTSPPYNTSRKGSSLDHLDNPQENIRYDVFDDCRSNEEYCDYANRRIRNENQQLTLW